MDRMASRLGVAMWTTSPGASATAVERGKAVGVRSTAQARASADETGEPVPSCALGWHGVRAQYGQWWKKEE
jgi:hypothetical protein